MRKHEHIGLFPLASIVSYIGRIKQDPRTFGMFKARFRCMTYVCVTGF